MSAHDPYVPGQGTGASAAPQPEPEFTGAPGETGSTGSIGQIVGQLTSDFTLLMKQEVALAKAEVTQSAKNAGKGVGMLGGAGVAAHMMLLFLSIAFWWWLGTHIGLGLSALIVALIWGAIAGILAMSGKKALSEVSGPTQTAETAKQIPDALKGKDHLQ